MGFTGLPAWEKVGNPGLRRPGRPEGTYQRVRSRLSSRKGTRLRIYLNPGLEMRLGHLSPVLGSGKRLTGPGPEACREKCAPVPESRRIPVRNGRRGAWLDREQDREGTGDGVAGWRGQLAPDQEEPLQPPESGRALPPALTRAVGCSGSRL